MMEKSFTINDNINHNVIKEFVDFYNTIDKNEKYEINVKIESNEIEGNEIEGKVVGEVDPVFLSYISLFLSDSPNSIIKFVFTQTELSDRAHSLKHQLEHIRFILSLKENQILLEGKYKDENEKTYDIKLYSYDKKVIKTTGEILKDKDENDAYFLTQSQSFIPLIFIDNNRNIFNRYFDSWDASDNFNPLYQKYYNKLVEEIPKRISEEKNWGNQTEFIDELELNKLSFIELTLLRVLLRKDIYEILGKEGGGSLSSAEKNARQKRNKEKIRYYLLTVKQVSRGLKELAINFEHSSEKKGVITARIFEKDRLIALKDEKLSSFLKERTEDYYKNHNEEQFFLDINVIDFGTTSIREKYIVNIEKNKSTFKEKLSENPDLMKLIGIDFDKDIKYISNITEFKYKDFFVLNEEIIHKITHQQNKLISRIGLHYFTQLIKNKFNGYIQTSSQKEGVMIYNVRNNESEEIEDTDFINYGTSYNCIIPLRAKELNIAKELPDSYSRIGTNINTFKDLSKYSIKEYSDTNIDPEPHIIYTYSNEHENEDEKYNNLINIYLDLLASSENKKKNILLIDAKKIFITENGNESEWVRLLSAINFHFKDVIIYNMKSELTRNIFQIRKAWSGAGLYFWHNDARVLFYSYKEDGTNEYKRFGANLLAGKSEDEFDILNTNIWKHHYSFREEFFNNPKNVQIKHLKENYQSKLYSGENLKYFELLIKIVTDDDGEISLFEKSVQYSLNTKLKSKISQNTNNKGYKISDTHFRLGSKIHIEDFYYAKKLYQNSFFTTPLAYLISQEILDKTKRNIDKMTLVGYENYSGFLVSTIYNMLIKELGDGISLNHCIIDKDGNVAIEIDKIKDKVIIIVPIASTFNTSIKIKNQLEGIRERERKRKSKDNINNIEFLTPFYNVVLVGHRDESGVIFKNQTDEEKKDNFFKFNNSLLQTYNWESINKDDNLIKVKIYKNKESDEEENENIIIQKYFIPLYTRWHNANECILCFTDIENKNITDERCLIETGSASITPHLIFGMPKTKEANETGGNYLDLTSSLLYGYLKKRNNSYLYYSRVGKLLKTNKENIKTWLTEKIKKEIGQVFVNKKVVIVSPSSGSRSHFIDMVNEFIFEYTANCLIITLDEDYIDNAESLYSDGLHKADYVVYVDDVLSTLNSFLKTNYIVKHIRNKIKKGKGIDYCISLINRMSYDTEENLLLKLVPLINDDCFKLIETIEETKKLQTEKKNNQEKIGENKVEIEHLSNKLIKEKIKLSQAKERLFYYTKINNPTIEEPNNEFPLKKERKRYKNLAETSSYDAIRQYFNKKIIKLSPHNLDDSLPDSIKDYIDSSDKKTFKHKKLYQLLVLNALYSLFEYTPNKSDELENYINVRNKKLNNWFGQDDISLIELKNEIKDVLKNEHKAHEHIISKNEENIEFVILKIICSTPLVYYEQIRESAFKWILNKLEEIGKDIQDINEENLSNFFSITGDKCFSQYQELKFLLKRSVELKSNYIIHPKFFKSIEILINLLKSNYKELETKKTGFDKEIINEIEALYESTLYTPGKLILYTYYQDLYALRLLPKKSNGTITTFDDKDFAYNLNKDIDKYNKERKEKEEIQAELFATNPKKEEKNKFETEEDFFKDKFEELKAIPRHSLKTSKKFIYHLVSLVQELEYEHETKALKLEENINSLIGLDKEGGAIDKKKYDDFKNNTENGNFYHYLRLLRLENTEAIEKFWQYIKEKESDKYTKHIGIKKIKNIPSTYKDDPKYIAIKRIQHIEDNGTDINEKSLTNYFLLKTELHNIEHNIEEPNNEQKENDGLENFVREKVLNLCSNIIDTKGFLEVEQAFLTVNFNEYAVPTYKDLYTFCLNDKSVIAGNEDAFNKTLTYMMIKGINAEKVRDKNYQLSNLEILKDDKGEPILREGMLTDVKETTDFKKLEKGRSILLIRISDFKNVFKNRNSEEKEATLITQAVLTFYLNKGERIPEEKLRLILLLRKSLSRFLKDEISANTYLELLNIDAITEYQRYLRHDIGNFISYQKDIIGEFEEIQSKISVNDIRIEIREALDREYIVKASFRYKEFLIINNLINSQMGISKQNISNNKTFFIEYFKDVINVIYKSKKLGDCVNKSCPTFPQSNYFEKLKIPIIVIDSIIPELIINQKKYGEKSVVKCKKTSNGIILIFDNSIASKGAGFGLNMCKNILKQLPKISLETKKNNRKFIATLTIKQ